MYKWMKTTYLTPYHTDGTLQAKFNYYNLKYMDVLSLVGERTADTYLWAFNKGYFLPDIFLIAAFLLTALLIATLYYRL